ncbi:fimbrial adhesin subunit [Salmonella enterica]|uniref:fimbrial adhesin subunit n=1 Tax=Salmonella enterica TaxID=28901 RepID=UPI0003BCF7B3|nr:fimbrial adhesin subunit [Salmonella enterica]ESH52094.1 fimbrial adhesin subunit [Salmonella enterica subsp. enterica serovar Berta str. ATCC 8392]
MNQYNSSIPKFIVSVFLIVTGFFSSTIKAQELKLMIKINEAVFYDRITSNKIIGAGHLFNREGKKILISSSLEKLKIPQGHILLEVRITQPISLG